ncbi:MAG: right-handed parallel beta-helix repeat-containing protein [Candidatus Brocadiia bacterium]|jgi:parallel beta-helix repeat protein
MKLCLAMLVLTTATAQAAETLRVAPGESLEQAIAKARTAPKPVTIELRGGTYFLDKPIALGPQDAGLTLAAYRDEKPVLSGGRRITGWRPGTDQVWTASVTGDFRELWVNGRRAVRARYPSQGYLAVAEVLDATPAEKWMEGQTRFRFKEGDLKAWPSMTEAEVVVMNRWVESRLPVVRVDENEKIVTFGKRSVFALDKGDLYYVENVREALAPGMWFLDRSSGSISYRPLPGEDLQTAEVIAPALPQVLRLEGAERVTLRGLTFAHTEWTLPKDSSGFPQAAVGVPGAVWGERARECAFEQCAFTHLGDYALELGRGCRNNRVAGCEMSDLGAGGVKIGETAIREDPADQTSANTVTDCRIHDGGKLFHSAVGVWIGQSADNVITHNLIHDFYYTAISIGWTWGYGPASATGNRVEWNHVHHVGALSDGDGPILSDMGGIYTLGNQHGAAIRNNLFHDIAGVRYGGWGIYFDEGTTDILAENNIVYRTTHGGFHQHYGKNNVVRNNIFAFGRDWQLQRTRAEPHLSFTFERNIVYWDKGNLLGGNWEGDQYAVSSNLLWRTDGKPLELPAGFQSGHSLIADPLFVAPANGDFSLRPESPAFGLGFKPIDVSQVGPRK